MSEFDVLELCEEGDGFYEVDPAVMFPAILERIGAVLKGADPVEIQGDNPEAAVRMVNEAKRFPKEAWQLAEQPFSEFADSASDSTVLASMKKASRNLRSDVLTFAESYFSRALAIKAGKGIRIHISKNLDFKRGV